MKNIAFLSLLFFSSIYTLKAQNKFALFLQSKPDLVFPLSINKSFMDSIGKNAVYMDQLSDTQINTFINQKYKFKIKFLGKSPHAIKVLGKNSIDGFVVVLYLIETKDSLCDYNQYRVFVYDSFGVIKSNALVSYFEDCHLGLSTTESYWSTSNMITRKNKRYRRKTIIDKWQEVESLPLEVFIFEKGKFVIK